MVKRLNPHSSDCTHEVMKMAQAQSPVNTMETQELIYKRRVRRFSVTRGVDRGKLIDRVNAVSRDKTPLMKRKK